MKHFIMLLGNFNGILNSVYSLYTGVMNDFNKQSNMEKLFIIYFTTVFILLIYIKIIYLISKKKNNYYDKLGALGINKRIIKILLFSALFIAIIVGSTLKVFIDNILTYLTVIFIVYYLADAVFVENGTILKLFNAEVKYDTIKENTNYMECLFKKNEMNSTLIEVTNRLIKGSSDLINNHRDAYNALKIITETYVKMFHLDIEIVSYMNQNKWDRDISMYLQKYHIFKDRKNQSKLSTDCKNGVISQVSENIFLVPVIGMNYFQLLAVKGLEVDAIDATNIKNVAVLLY